MTSYRYEREIFDVLKRTCSKDCKKEYERAVKTLIYRYNTSVYENRFVVGGALEVFTLGLMRTVGIQCKLVSDRSTGGDILLENDLMFSLKSSFVGLNDIRLINQMGKGKRNWATATLIILSDTGIVFGTPELVAKSEVQATGDAILLKKSGLKRLISDKNNIFSLSIPSKLPAKLASSSLKASNAVARQILYDTNSRTLLTAVEP